jgi:SulP family sulfate permease
MRAGRRRHWSRTTIRKDVQAGLVLGVESVPDGLASGLLAGVNPLAGLYAYLFGIVGAAAFTSTTFMAVTATGAMALVVADADLGALPDPDRALFTLTMLCGIVMIAAGLLRAGRLISFVPTAVMTGFITAVGVNIVLGQLSNFTGFAAEGANRVLRTLDLLRHVPEWQLPTLAVGLVTVLTIVVLDRTPVGSLGLVVAVVFASAFAALLNSAQGPQVLLLGDLLDVPAGLPMPVLPSLGDVPYLIIPALSLAFVGLVQGAGVAAGVSDGKPVNTNRDFIGQGAGNLVAGLFRGMPVGGSMSASSIAKTSGAQTRLALFVAGAVMALIIVFASDLVAYAAMPALAGLLIVVGVRAVKPSRVYSVIRTGPLQSVVMAVTFVLTLIIPLQYAVLVGVGLGVVLFVAQQSNRVRVRRVELAEAGRLRESDPPAVVPGGQVTVLQPYGSLFFASTPTVERQLPAVDESSRGAIVILRLRGTDEIGLGMIDVLRRFHGELTRVGGSLRIVASEPRVLGKLETSGLTDELGARNVYRGSEWVGDTLRRAVADATDELDRV